MTGGTNSEKATKSYKKATKNTEDLAMPNPKKILPILLAVTILTLALTAICPSVYADEQPTPEPAAKFQYVHDPCENPTAMKDIVKDDTAVYGFRPSETGSLKQYAAADWSDPDLVESGRLERIAYHKSIESLYDMLDQMQAEGKPLEDIARAVSQKRNELRLEACKDYPEALAALIQRNLEKYGHEEGPLPDELYAQYGSWETVIEKAFSANVGMDACLGLYDDYYDLYVALGQVEPDANANPSNPATGDTANVLLWICLAASGGTLLATFFAGKKQKGFRK